MKTNGEEITLYIKGTKCRNKSNESDFTCSGKYGIDEDGIWDTVNGNYIYMPKIDYWAEITPPLKTTSKRI